MKVLIIIPAHNEESRIDRTLKAYVNFFKKKKDIGNFEILVVLNACNDNTLTIVKNLKKKYKEIDYLNLEKAGKGFAVKEGFIYGVKGNYDLIGFVDADMSTSAEEYYKLIKNIGNYSGVIASRYIKGAKMYPKQTLLRQVASRAFNFLARALFSLNYRDTQCGAKIFRKELVEIFARKMGLTNWIFDVDLLYIADKNNFRIKEYPTIWKDEEGSKLNIKRTSLQVFFAVFQLRILNSKAKIFYKVLKPIGGWIYRKLK